MNWSVSDRLLLGVLIVDAALLAVVEVMFLPLYWGAVPFPITAAVAAVTTPFLVVAAGKLGFGARGASAPLVAWFLTVFVVGVLGPGGDIVLLSDWRTLLLLAGGTVPSAVLLGLLTARQQAQAGRARP
ncbi:hypothetical protein GIY23_04255 [Allosaccharopolyspora coralli]|uniref:Facilitated glucose transporter n=1 Tax=Allosaccharopolyspora coralli TaxID=2665642 RepID=A0A5Q3QB73_9PSEU|nr:hypothetical protein [Allosaccharopolyspora coralli]QGK68859.1 hypothetical protein GIY23_04255 [Allosaccharopolyspora coralli]